MTLEVRHLSTFYRKRQVLFDLCMEVKRGEVVGLLGPNGAGKTTAFYAIAGLTLTEETVFLDGTDISGLPLYQRARLGLSYLPQEKSLFLGMSVEENILSVLEFWEKDKKKRYEKLEELLLEFSLHHVRSTRVELLSGGEKRRGEVVRALAADPFFFLLDEPLAGVDPVAVGEVTLVIEKLKKRGLGILITDHNVYEALKVIDRGYVLHKGQLVSSGTPDEIVEDEKVREVFLGQDFIFR